MLSKRIRVLIEFKKHEETGISKREVAAATGANHNSVQAWRNLYMKGGNEALLGYVKHEGRPSLLTNEEYNDINLFLWMKAVLVYLPEMVRH